ncbi:MAG: hypothetical protein WD512_02825, partial [Candidatus Paceibacterota bacterium]
RILIFFIRPRKSRFGTRYGQVGGAAGAGRAAGAGGNNTVRQGDLGGAPFDRVGGNINMMQNTFDISDDVPEIAANYIPDRYNMKYSGNDEWDVIDPDIKGVTAPRNPGLVASPDRIISPITQQRTVLDKIWQRPVSADIDTFNINQRNLMNSTDNFGGIGTPSGRTNINNNHMIRAPSFQENLSNGNVRDNGINSGGVANTASVANSTGAAGSVGASGSGSAGVGGVGGDTCSGQNCLDMLEKIMKCEDCVKKLRKLLGIPDKNTNWFDLSEVNVSKLVFWVIAIILIVAVYELLNTVMTRIRG